MDTPPSAYKVVGKNRYREVSGLFFEDFVVGDVFEHRPGRTVLEVDNTYITLLTMNSMPLHFDWNYASRTEFKRPLMNSLVTIAIVTGMSVHSISQNAVANLGWDRVRMPNPVFAGDTLYAETQVLEKRESSSRPGQGIVKVHTMGTKVDGQTHESGIVVIEFDRTVLVYKRGQGPHKEAGY
jgi:itaconyl-CoA hydratase